MSSKNTLEKQSNSPIPWEQIEKNLGALVPVSGGHSEARRGIVTVFGGKKIFVKIGGNERTRDRAAKEITSYAFLKECGYPFIPKVLSTKPDQTGFALEALLPEDGWDWSSAWTKDRLDTTLKAMDALAAIKPDAKHAEQFKPVITDADNGWIKLVASPERQTFLVEKLRTESNATILDSLTDHAEIASRFKVRHDALVHNDVRADNCAWNKEKGEVRLIDWDWLELGDRRIDLAAFLVHVEQSGFDALAEYSKMLDAEALHWLAGFWFYAASSPMWPGGHEKLRDFQLRSGLMALKLSEEVAH